MYVCMYVCIYLTWCPSAKKSKVPMMTAADRLSGGANSIASSSGSRKSL